MKDEVDVQKLIALKSYEKPSDAYFETFLRDFQQRQRSEVLRFPAHRLVLERVDTWMRGVHGYRWASGVAGVLLVSALATLVVKPRESGSGAVVAMREPGRDSSGSLLLSSAAAGRAGEFEPNPVRVYWETETGVHHPISGIEVADGMFVCARPGASLAEAVRVERPSFEARAHVVLVDQSSGLVLLDGRSR